MFEIYSIREKKKCSEINRTEWNSYTKNIKENQFYSFGISFDVLVDFFVCDIDYFNYNKNEKFFFSLN